MFQRKHLLTQTIEGGPYGLTLKGIQRIDRVIAASGKGSRKEVRQWIKAGRVTIDGKEVLDPGTRIDWESASIELDGEPLEAGPLTFMLNKPRGVVTARSDPHLPTVLDLFPKAVARRVFPAGRLDKETEGLLIVTDDGKLCHRLISPKHHVEKEYDVQVDGTLSSELPEAFHKGVLLKDGYKTLPAQLTIVTSGPNGRARVTLREGKYHQVRRMFAAFGLKVTGLKRIRIGGLMLDPELSPGEYRRLAQHEKELLFIS